MRGLIVWRNGSGGTESRGMLQRRPGAILSSPIVVSPRIAIKVADAGMARGNPIIAGKSQIKDLIHIFVNGDVGIEKDANVVGGELESAEFGPCVFETGCDELYGAGRL